jgi:GntR family transcriptional repressor for pyruvate dehydrogenase complex
MPSVKGEDEHSAEIAQENEGRTFVKVRRVRSFDDVVEQVRAAIIDGSILAGERLPSERELAEQFGVSRATLREALRALEAVGLIEIRLGAHGGAFATEGDDDRAAELLRQVYDVEVATRPNEARQFRASFHADNVGWLEESSEDLTRISESVPRGSAAFLIALAEGSRMPFRVALAAGLESGASARMHPVLTESEMNEMVDLLHSGHRAECRQLLVSLLGGAHLTESAR